jgi:hypothetical protein
MKTILRKNLLPVLALAALIVSGCKDIVSVYPFYTEKDLVFEPALVGVWIEEGKTNGVEGMEFTKASGRKYMLAGYPAEGTNSCSCETNVFEVCLFRLKAGLFMDWDMTPEKSQCTSIPQHHLFKVTELGSALEMKGLNYDWLRPFLKQHPKALRHILKNHSDKDSDIILTADTRELQQFLIKYSNVAEVFGTNDALRWTRLAAGQKAQPLNKP